MERMIKKVYMHNNINGVTTLDTFRQGLFFQQVSYKIYSV